MHAFDLQKRRIEQIHSAWKIFFVVLFPILFLQNCSNPTGTNQTNIGTLSNPEPLTINHLRVGTVAKEGTSYFKFIAPETRSYTIKVSNIKNAALLEFQIASVDYQKLSLGPYLKDWGPESEIVNYPEQCDNSNSFRVSYYTKFECTYLLEKGIEYPFSISNRYVCFTSGECPKTMGNSFSILIEENKHSEGSLESPVPLLPSGTTTDHLIYYNDTNYYFFVATSTIQTIKIIPKIKDSLFGGVGMRLNDLENIVRWQPRRFGLDSDSGKTCPSLLESQQRLYSEPCQAQNLAIGRKYYLKVFADNLSNKFDIVFQ